MQFQRIHDYDVNVSRVVHRYYKVVHQVVRYVLLKSN